MNYQNNVKTYFQKNLWPFKNLSCYQNKNVQRKPVAGFDF